MVAKSKGSNSMTTPQHYTSLASAICSLFGEGTKIESTSRISGGDINEAYGLTLTDGKCIFMKSNAKENLSFFTAEALTDIRRATLSLSDLLIFCAENVRRICIMFRPGDGAGKNL